MMSVLVLIQEEADMATQQDTGQAEATAGKARLATAPSMAICLRSVSKR